MEKCSLSASLPPIQFFEFKFNILDFYGPGSSGVNPDNSLIVNRIVSLPGNAVFLARLLLVMKCINSYVARTFDKSLELDYIRIYICPEELDLGYSTTTYAFQLSYL